MPSGFLTSLPTNVLLDAGVLSINGSTFGVSRGGIHWQNNEEWQNIGFDGKRSDVAGLDRKITDEQIISATFIEMSLSRAAQYLNQGGIAGMASQSYATAAAFSYATAATYAYGADGVPNNATQLCNQGQYAKNVKCLWPRGGGGNAYINFALAYVAEWRMVGGTKDAAEISAVFKARNDYVTTSDIDAALITAVLTP